MIVFNAEKCIGCGLCLTVCPRQVIALNNKKANVQDYTSCMECGACSMNCPTNAIDVTVGTGCLRAIVLEDILKIVPKGCGCECGC